MCVTVLLTYSPSWEPSQSNVTAISWDVSSKSVTQYHQKNRKDSHMTFLDQSFFPTLSSSSSLCSLGVSFRVFDRLVKSRGSLRWLSFGMPSWCGRRLSAAVAIFWLGLCAFRRCPTATKASSTGSAFTVGLRGARRNGISAVARRRQSCL